jgi:hypothetical protein
MGAIAVAISIPEESTSGQGGGPPPPSHTADNAVQTADITTITADAA